MRLLVMKLLYILKFYFHRDHTETQQARSALQHRLLKRSAAHARSLTNSITVLTSIGQYINHGKKKSPKLFVTEICHSGDDGLVLNKTGNTPKVLRITEHHEAAWKH